MIKSARQFPVLERIWLWTLAGFTLFGIVAAVTTLVIVDRTMSQLMIEEMVLHPERASLADLAATQQRVMSTIYALLGLIVCLGAASAWLMLRPHRPKAAPQ